MIDDIVRMGSALFRNPLPQQVALPQAEVEGRRDDQSFNARLHGYSRGRRQPHVGREPEHARAGFADSIHLSHGQRPLRTVRAKIADNQNRGRYAFR